MISLLLLPKKSAGYKRTIDALQNLSNSQKADEFNDDIKDMDKYKKSEFALCDVTDDYEKSKTIYGNSSFYREASLLQQHFMDEEKAEVECNDENLEPNPHYKPAFLDMFLKKYISLAPLFVNVVSSRVVSTQSLTFSSH